MAKKNAPKAADVVSIPAASIDNEQTISRRMSEMEGTSTDTWKHKPTSRRSRRHGLSHLSGLQSSSSKTKARQFQPPFEIKL